MNRGDAPSCGICGLPFNAHGLRGISTARAGDDLRFLLDDTCNCGKSPQSPGDTEYHGLTCNWTFAYDGTHLTAADISWLENVRMICMRTPATWRLTATEKFGNVFVSAIGRLNHSNQVLLSGGERYVAEHSADVPPGADSSNAVVDDKDIQGPELYTLNPHTNGFPVHDKCYKMLRHVHSTSAANDQPFDLHRLFFTMRTLKRESGVVDWKDPRSYFDIIIRFFQNHGCWIPQRKFEYLVAEPSSYIDTKQLINFFSSDKIVQKGSPYWETFTEDLPRGGPFNILPPELRMMILELLPSRDVHHLSMSSPAFHAMLRRIPNSFWRSRLEHDYRWLDNEEFCQALAETCRPINYFALLNQLDAMSKPMLEGDVPGPGEQATFALRNQRRIWSCCEIVLDKMKLPWFMVRKDNSLAFVQSTIVPTQKVRSTFTPFLPKLDYPETTYYVPLDKPLSKIDVSLPVGEIYGIGGLLLTFADSDILPFNWNFNPQRSLIPSCRGWAMFDNTQHEELHVVQTLKFNRVVEGVKISTTIRRVYYLGNFTQSLYPAPQGPGLGERVGGLRIVIGGAFLSELEPVIVAR